MATTELQLRAQMCEIGRRLWQRGLVGAAEGNLSVRLGPRSLLCTPTGMSKGHLKPNDLVVIDLQGQPSREESRMPSSEIKLHLKIYAKRPDCVAVIHAHPPTATGFALAGEEIPDNLLPEAAMVLGSVATAPFAMPGTQEVPDSIDPLVEDHKTILLSHHGAVVMGLDLEDAYNRMETLERIARIVLTARLLGDPKPIPAKAFDELLKTSLTGRLER
ncbi:MAG TPA: class II aldolase/adducin family protein [Fimbriimonadaceae bacterium]|nr:class II aldolase/adducin family protein [Fimbriimonadaceae bacterium]HRJ33415.1 class II aldolase/adducin family protein [Fimbriimonadaceae bacterium]